MKLGLWASLLGTALAPLDAQSPVAGEPRHSVSIFIGAGLSGVTGGSAENAAAVVSPMGLAFERKINPRLAWRGELTVSGTSLGAIPDPVLGGEGSLTRAQFGVGASIRRYAAQRNGRRLFGALGGSLAVETLCDVDYPAAGFTGATYGCSEAGYESASMSSSLTAAAGVAWSRWAIELRYDQGISEILKSSTGGMRAWNVGIVVHRAFGKRRSNALVRL